MAFYFFIKLNNKLINNFPRNKNNIRILTNNFKLINILLQSFKII